MRGIRTLIIFMFITAVCNTRLPGQTGNGMPDKEQLTIALEYFSSGKYIEAFLQYLSYMAVYDLLYFKVFVYRLTNSEDLLECYGLNILWYWRCVFVIEVNRILLKTILACECLFGIAKFCKST